MKQIEDTVLVPRLPEDDGITVKLEKCVFFSNIITHIAYVTKPEKLELASHSADDIKITITNHRDVVEVTFRIF